jgi:hypothetical protein
MYSRRNERKEYQVHIKGRRPRIGGKLGTRSKSLIADNMTSDPDDQERLPVPLSTVFQRSI